MTNNDFDADIDQMDDDFGAPDEAGADMGDDLDGGAGQGAAPKKSGGGFGKILLILIVLGGGGIAGAAKMGFVKLPFDIPGLTPVKTAKAPPQPAPAQNTHVAKAQSAEVKKSPMSSPASDNAKLMDTGNGALPSPVVAEDRPMPELPTPELKKAPVAPPAQLLPGQNDADPLALSSGPGDQAAASNGDESHSAQMLMPDAIGSKETGDNRISAPTEGADAATAPGISAPDMNDNKPAAPTASVAAAPIPPAADMSTFENRFQALDARISAIESKLNDLSVNQVKKSDLSDLQISINSLKAQMASGAAVRPATPAVHHHAPASAAAHQAARKPAPAVSTHWALKSAKPGMAWVSAAGSDDMRTVSVGDSLPGLGKITDISKGADGHWHVSGTRGKINQ
jgi:intracellular multiplication protein IcmG